MNTAPVLQVVALTLPAVALYMSVLSDLYESAELARKQYPASEDKDTAFRKPGVQNIPGKKVERGWVTLTTMMDGWDFRLATLSMGFLCLSAVLLLPATVVSIQYIAPAGVGLATLGFTLLVIALAYTTYATLTGRYPNS